MAGKARRRPFGEIQTSLANEVAKKAKDRIRTQNTGAVAVENSSSSGGVLDKIEQMLAEGKYRPDNLDGVKKGGYRIRRKGQPTVYVRIFLFN